MRVKRARRAGQDASTSFRRSIRGHDENAMALRMGGKSGCRVVAQAGTECHAEEKCQRRRRTPAGEGSEVQKAGRGESFREVFSRFCRTQSCERAYKGAPATPPVRHAPHVRGHTSWETGTLFAVSPCSQASSRPWSTDAQRVSGLVRECIHRIRASGFAHVDAGERSPCRQSGMLRM